jgi:hypothetical protein
MVRIRRLMCMNSSTLLRELFHDHDARRFRGYFAILSHGHPDRGGHIAGKYKGRKPIAPERQQHVLRLAAEDATKTTASPRRNRC